MKNDKEHLKIDLDFLDKKETPHIATPKTPPPTSTASHTPPPVKPTATPVSTGYKLEKYSNHWWYCPLFWMGNILRQRKFDILLGLDVHTFVRQ
jgi:hypothetical protein